MGKKVLLIIAVVVMALCLAAPGMAADKVVKWKVQGFVPAGMLFHESLVRLADTVNTDFHTDNQALATIASLFK